jgi:adenosylcobinamide-phosphate synthase
VADIYSRILLVNNPVALLAGLAIGVLLDLAYPYHRGVTLKLHPVHTCYIYSKRLSRPYASRLHGIVNAASCLLIHLSILVLLILASLKPGGASSLILTAIIAGLTVKLSVSIRLLFTEARKTGRALSRGDLDEARRVVGGLVRRDTRSLGPGHVASASIESLAESLVDGITSPLLYYLSLGPIGSLLQRLANTLDGSLGFKDPELIDQGWFSAKLDTLLNYIPARITGLLILLAGRRKRSLPRLILELKRQAGLLESRNAGWPIAAMALSLGVKLEKPGYYTVGTGRLPSDDDVERALVIASHVVVAYLVIVISLYIIIALAAGWFPVGLF